MANFNRAPYYDDFDENKKFLQILFQPGRPVQARELTQLQSILQNQIERGGAHIFKQGSKVFENEVVGGKQGYDSETNQLIVSVDPRYFRPSEVDTLLGDPSKAKEKLGWEPKITIKQMVDEMMENDINIAKRDSLVKKHGFKAPDFNE